MMYGVVNTMSAVGKTITAVHLATMLARTERTLLIDEDPQARAASWAAWFSDAQREPSPTTGEARAGRGHLVAGAWPGGKAAAAGAAGASKLTEGAFWACGAAENSTIALELAYMVLA